MNLFDIIKERPLAEDPEGDGSCPYCGSTETELLGEETTLLGWTGSVNPNHRRQTRSCKGCSRGFTREIRGVNVWYTEHPRVILRGVPSCFEDYVYTCIKCGAAVRRDHFDLQGNPAKFLSSRLVGDEWVRGYTTRYACTQCGHGGETAEDYWDGRTQEGDHG